MNVLVVDSDKANRDRLIAFVEHDKQCEAFGAGTSVEACSWLDQETFKLIILDAYLSDVSDVIAIQHIRRMEKESPLFLIRSQFEKAEHDQYRELGVSDFLARPVELDHLGQLMEQWLPGLQQSVIANKEPLDQTLPDEDLIDPFESVVSKISHFEVSGIQSSSAMECEVPGVLFVGTNKSLCRIVRATKDFLLILNYDDVPKADVFVLQMPNPDDLLEPISLKVQEIDRLAITGGKAGRIKLLVAVRSAPKSFHFLLNKLESLSRIAPKSSKSPLTNTVPDVMLRTTGSFSKRMFSGKRYQCDRLLGSGGFSDVYRVQDLALKRMVAMKVLHSRLARNKRFREQFLQEAQIAAQFHHSNIVFVFEVGEFLQSEYEDYLSFPPDVLSDYPGRFIFFTMQYIQGHSLGTLLREQHRFSMKQSIDILIDVAQAVAYSHQKGVIHHDIKPDNIMISDNGQVIVTDFGIARFGKDHLSEEDQTPIALTPRYASPEQLLHLDATYSSDMYSFGTLAFHMLAGRTPFDSDELDELTHQKVHRPAPPLAAFVPELDPKLEALVTTCLSTDPSSRFDHMDDIVAGLKDIRSKIASEDSYNSINKATQLLAELLTTHDERTAANLMVKLTALIQIYRLSDSHEEINKIKNQLLQAEVMEQIVNQHLTKKNKAVLFPLFRVLESSQAAFHFLRHFQDQNETWRKVLLAQLAVISSGNQLEPIVAFGTQLKDEEAAIIVQGFHQADVPDLAENLLHWVEFQGEKTMMALLKICAVNIRKVPELAEVVMRIKGRHGHRLPKVRDFALKVLR